MADSKLAGRDFFVSYTQSDKPWAQWIGWQLEDSGYTVVMQAWDFKPGSDFLADMKNAVSSSGRTLLVLTRRALKSRYVQHEVSGALFLDKLISVRIEKVDLEGPGRSLTYIDLVGCDEDQARLRLLQGLQLERLKPEVPPPFPSQQRPAYPSPPGVPIFKLLALVAGTIATAVVLVLASLGFFTSGHDVWRDCGGCPEMVRIPAGSFTMGSDDGPRIERPARTIAVANDFAMSIGEVTLGEWRQCGPCMQPEATATEDELPVSGISWDDAMDFVDWLSNLTGQSYRLPSEAEWEYVASADGGTPLNSTAANVDNRDGPAVQVDRFPANSFSVANLWGNVWEWTADCGLYYDVSEADSATVAHPDNLCAQRVLRGSSYKTPFADVQSSRRYMVPPAYRAEDTGLRVVRALSASDQ